jgi:predicted amidohydrolase
LDNAITLEAGDLQPLCAAAKQHHVTVVCGINERDSTSSRATLYNTVVVIARRALDVAGHYARPDIFTLHVNTRQQSPVKFD